MQPSILVPEDGIFRYDIINQKGLRSVLREVEVFYYMSADSHLMSGIHKTANMIWICIVLRKCIVTNSAAAHYYIGMLGIKLILLLLYIGVAMFLNFISIALQITKYVQSLVLDMYESVVLDNVSPNSPICISSRLFYNYLQSGCIQLFWFSRSI